jgi:hypothetical protein
LYFFFFSFSGSGGLRGLAAGRFFGGVQEGKCSLLYLFEALGFVALFLGRLVESWMVEMGIRTCLSPRLPFYSYSPAGNSASGCIRHVGFSFPAFVSIRTQLRRPR